MRATSITNISTSRRTSLVRGQTNLFIPCGDQNQCSKREDNKLILKLIVIPIKEKKTVNAAVHGRKQTAGVRGGRDVIIKRSNWVQMISLFDTRERPNKRQSVTFFT